jgi:hypothetical protein
VDFSVGKAHYFLKNKELSALGDKINLPIKQNIDKKLIIGSSLFGIGWGGLLAIVLDPQSQH